LIYQEKCLSIGSYVLAQFCGDLQSGRDAAVMNLSTHKAVGALLLPFFWLGLQQAAHAENQDTIDYREAIMKQLDAEAAAIGMIVSGQVPADSLALQAKALANSAKSALKAFEPRVPGGEAKPEVWTKWDDFSKRFYSRSIRAIR
jgi:cytochrome c556